MRPLLAGGLDHLLVYNMVYSQHPTLAPWAPVLASLILGPPRTILCLPERDFDPSLFVFIFRSQFTRLFISSLFSLSFTSLISLLSQQKKLDFICIIWHHYHPLLQSPRQRCSSRASSLICLPLNPYHPTTYDDGIVGRSRKIGKLPPITIKGSIGIGS